MKKMLIIFCLLFVSSFLSYSQPDPKSDPRYVVGIDEFDNSKTNSKFARSVADKVDEIVTKSKRFYVVNRLNLASITREKELQKTEAFMDSKSLVDQSKAAGAKFKIIGTLIKLPVYAMKNGDGSINGYRASASFKLQMVDVETTQATEAESFETDDSPIMQSPESALNEALKTIEPNMIKWLNKTFPVRTFIKKLLTSKGGEAKTVLIGGGKTFGFKVGDELEVQIVEIIDGKEFPKQIGEIEIKKLAGDDFAECSVSDGEEEIYKLLSATPPTTLKCELKK